MAFKITKHSLRKAKILFLVLAFFLILYNLSSAVFITKSKYLSFDYWHNFPSLKSVYLRSQYVSKHPTAIIPDETVNSYAAGAYIKGVSPVLIAADTPPLGRYLIGLSALVFNNENVVTLFFSIFALYLMYKISSKIFSSKQLAIIPPLLFSFEPIFKNQIIYSPLLDMFQLVFLLGAFYFFNQGLSSKKILLSFITANVFLGLFISTKFFITGITIILAWALVLVLRKEKERLKILITTLPISVFILLLSYIRLFAYHYTFKSFLGVQKYVFLYHKSQLILPLSIWPLLIFNRWYVWFGNKPVISDPQWMLSWPLLTIISLITIIIYILGKIPKNNNAEVLMSWVVFYVLFFSFGQISSRYFVILIPVLYIISLYGIISFLKVRKK